MEEIGNACGRKKLRLLVITPHFLPDTAPTGTIITELTQQWCEQGHEIHVITSLPWYEEHKVAADWKKGFIDRELHDSLRITRLHPFPFNKSSFFLRALGFLLFSLFTSAVSIFSRGPFDAVFCLSPPITFGTVGKIASKRHRCPLVLNIQDIFPDVAIETGILKSQLLIRLSKRLEVNSYKFSSVVTVLSEGMKENINRKLFEQKKMPAIEVIPNFAYTNFFALEEDESYKKENQLEGKNIVMYAGNLGHSQPLEIMVNAAKAHFDKENLIYVVNGSGVKAEYVKEEAKKLNNLRFVDFQPLERLPNVLSSADIHLVMLKSGLGNLSVPSKIYNIFASGKPVVASVDSDTEIARVVRDAEAGFVVDPHDPSAFFKAIELLTDDYSLRKEMGTSAKRWAEKWHTSENISKKYTDLITGIITK